MWRSTLFVVLALCTDQTLLSAEIPHMVFQMELCLSVRPSAIYTEDKDEWCNWTTRAFQSVYGYEYQGDNLLLARANLLLSFVEYYFERWKRSATCIKQKSCRMNHLNRIGYFIRLF